MNETPTLAEIRARRDVDTGFSTKKMFSCAIKHIVDVKADALPATLTEKLSRGFEYEFDSRRE